MIIYLTPFVPLSFKGEGEGEKEGLPPLLDTPIRLFSKGIERGEAPLRNYLPSPLMKGRGIKGEGLVNNDKGKEEDMVRLDMKQFELAVKQQYVRLLDLLARVIYANKDLTVSDVNDGERLEDAHGLAFKFFGHALSVLYLSHGTNQELPSLKWHTVDFASIDVITRAALEAFLIFHHVFYASAEPEEKDYRYWAYKAEGMANRQRIMEFAGTEKERQQLAVEKKELNDRLESNQIFQSLSTGQKGRVFEGKERNLWRWNPDLKKVLSWSDIAIDAGFSEMLASHMYRHLSGHAHSSSLSVLQSQQVLINKERAAYWGFNRHHKYCCC